MRQKCLAKLAMTSRYKVTGLRQPRHLSSGASCVCSFSWRGFFQRTSSVCASILLGGGAGVSKAPGLMGLSRTSSIHACVIDTAFRFVNGEGGLNG